MIEIFRWKKEKEREKQEKRERERVGNVHKKEERNFSITFFMIRIARGDRQLIGCFRKKKIKKKTNKQKERKRQKETRTRICPSQ